MDNAQDRTQRSPEILPTGITESEFDFKSIMLNAFHGVLFMDGKGSTDSNAKLTALDVKPIKTLDP